MAEEWKETMAAQKLDFREEEKKPTPNPVLQACGAYKEARMDAAESELRRWEVAVCRGEDPEVTRLRQQGALEREVRAIHAERLAKAPVQALQPVQEEEGEGMKEDEEESGCSVGGGTRSAQIEVRE